MADTIYALASAAGKAGVSVIRISGPDAKIAAERLAGNLPKARHAYLRKLIGENDLYLDEALVFFFEKGASFTGEIVVEFQTHGSIAIVQTILFELSKIDGLRLAEPGEFTKRALENNKLDLTQVEALSDLIEAETELQRRQALDILQGAFSDKIGIWRDKLVRACALLEAVLDFADEDVPTDVTPEVEGLLNSVVSDFKTELSSLKGRERIRSGFEVALIGAPNSGKSSLMNHLVGRDVAITSDIAGTTRDVIEVRLDIKGLPVTLLDTAGLREATDEVEKIGIDRAIQRAKNADMRIYLDAGDSPNFALSDDDIKIRSKVDALGGEGISSVTGEGVDCLLENIYDTLSKKLSNSGLSNRERHRMAIENGSVHINKALTLLESGPELYDIASEEIRLAHHDLAVLLGIIGVEDVLDVIFSSFCLGK